MIIKLIPFIILIFSSLLFASDKYDSDIIPTANGDLKITFIAHGTLMLTYNNMIIHVDPGKYADYSTLPKADLILCTHHHDDHLKGAKVGKLRTPETIILLTSKSTKKVSGGIVMNNGDIKNVLGIKIEAVPAYNIINMREPGIPFHPKGEGNGYVLTFADKKIYIAGDTENIPEMKNLTNIDIAFLPMNLPYTMTPEMMAEAAKSFRPKVLYPYHFGETDLSTVPKLLKGSGIEVRIKKLGVKIQDRTIKMH